MQGQDQQANEGQDQQANEGQEQSTNEGQDQQANEGQDQQANEGKDQQANEGQDQSANEDEALLVQYQHKLYIVNPAPQPEQPVILVNEGGELNGVFLKARKGDDGSGIIYELDDTQAEEQRSENNEKEENEELHTINLQSKYTYKGSMSDEDETLCTVKRLVVKEQGFKTDSELERCGVIKYKTMQQYANITHNEANGSETKKQKGSDIMHDEAEASEMKDTEKGSETKQDNGHVTKDSSAVMDEGENERPRKAMYIKMKMFHCSLCLEAFYTSAGLQHHKNAHEGKAWISKEKIQRDLHLFELEKEIRNLL